MIHVASLRASAAIALTLSALGCDAPAGETDVVERMVPAGSSSLYTRVVGEGRAVIVLHGGPDFDHGYFLPALDALGDSFRLIYYDQRGRGRSAEGVEAGDVTLSSELDDLDLIRRSFELESTILLGHSWGTVLALEYALRHPSRVSHLVLMNPAPASTSDVALLRTFYGEKLGAEMDRQQEILTSEAYRAGDPAAVTERYRIHFRPAFRYEQPYETLMAIMEAGFHAQGSAGILKARAVEDALMAETWADAAYDLHPEMRDLDVPTLVIAGADDFIPVQVAAHIVEALPRAELVLLEQCGHFSYLECAADVRRALDVFFAANGAER